MTFYEVLEQVVTLLQRHGRMSYRALTRQFQLDETYLEDLKTELVNIQRVAVDQDGTRKTRGMGSSLAMPHPWPNIPAELTAHSAGFLVAPGLVAVGRSSPGAL